MHFRFALPLLALFSLGGCIVIRTPHHSSGSSSSSRSHRASTVCHPSQYWDGEHCVHKGKGRGARKHDD